MPNPISRLLHSSKFLLLCLDVVLSLTLYFVGKYAPASVFEDIKVLIAALQPVFVSLIVAISIEDAAEKGNPALADEDYIYEDIRSKP
jgi:hypothetical protein